ncbi:MAG: SurA N-terminal domain-containing protein [Candidatus Krumholzibacteriia bacterium]
MFKFLRSNAKFFYWIIAATFIAFIFVAWGMDVSGSRGAHRGGNAIGAVNGVEISAMAYDNAVRQVQASMRRNAPDRPITANQAAMAQDQAWQQLVRERIMLDEIQRLGLTVTDAEILQIFRESPPPEILQAFTDENGQPDLQAYQAALGNPDSGINWREVENYVRQNVPRQKLAQIITAGVTVSDDSVRELYVNQTGRVVAEYMGVALNDLAADYEPSDEEIQAYYQANGGLYQQGRRGLAKVAVWEVKASESDYAEVRDLALEIKRSIESGEQTFEAAAAVYSEDATADSGGDLGTFDRNRMVAPFTEAAFSLPVGQISDPIRTEFGYHLIEVLEQEKENGEVARVHARHILLKVEPSEETRDAIYQHVNEFRTAVNRTTFLTTAGEDSTCQVLTPRPFLEGRDIPGLAQSSAGGRFVFRAKIGAISPIYSTDQNLYVVLADGTEPAGPRPLEEVRGQVSMALKRERQRTEAEAKLSPAVGRVQMGETMAKVAADLGLLHAVTDTLSANANVPDVGYATPFNTVALRSEVGQMVPEVATTRGVFALKVLWKKPFDDADWAARRDQLRDLLLRQKQNQALEAWFAEREEAAKIEDWRDTLSL